MAEGYVFKISGDIAAYASELAKVPGVTDKAAASAALKMGQQFAKMEADAAKSAKGAAKESADAWKGAGSAMKALGLEGLKGQIEDTAEAFTALAADPLVAAVAGFAAIAAAAGLGVVALGAATLAADDALTALDGFKAIGSDFYPSVPKETIQSIKNVNAAFDALLSIGQRLVVDVGGNVAPAFEKAANAAVGLALEGMELFEAFSKGRNLLEDFAVFMAEGFFGALLAPLAPIQGLAKSIVYLSEVTGVALPDGAKDALIAFDNLNKTLAKSAITAIENSDTVKTLGTSLEGASAKGAAFIGVQERVTASQKDGAKAAKEQADAEKKAANELAASRKKAADAYKADVEEEEKAQKDFASGIERLQEASKKATEAQLSGTAALKAAKKEELAALEATYQKTLKQASGDPQRLEAIKAYEAAKYATTELYDQKIAKSARDTAAAQKAAVEGYVSAASSAVGGLESSFGQLLQSIDPEGHKKAYLAIWRAQKAAAVAQATVNAALGVSQALASAPPPLNLVLATIAGVAGAINVGVIAASPPPKFHAGTMYASQAGGLAADEFSATLQRGEIVVDRQTASQPGVRESVAAMSTGTSTQAIHPDDVAEGMDRSSVPPILIALLNEFRRINNRPPIPQQSGRPGHRPSYGY